MPRGRKCMCRECLHNSDSECQVDDSQVSSRDERGMDMLDGSRCERFVNRDEDDI